MAPRLFDLTSQYDLLKSIAQNLWSRALLNLAKACVTLSIHFKASKKTLLDPASHCDGSSGRVWQSDWQYALDPVLESDRRSMGPSSQYHHRQHSHHDGTNSTD